MNPISSGEYTEASKELGKWRLFRSSFQISWNWIYAVHELNLRFVNPADRGNIEAQNDQLVAEIVTADQPGCRPGRPRKPRLSAWRDILVVRSRPLHRRQCLPPRVGPRVKVVGLYVPDANHEWRFTQCGRISRSAVRGEQRWRFETYRAR